MQMSFKLEISRVPKELKLMLKIIRSNPISKEDLLGIDWSKFYEFAIHHRVYPKLYSIVERQYQQIIPYKFIKELERNYQINTCKMLHLTAQMEQFSKLCADNNIPLIVLKGPILAQDLYGDLSLRTCGDLDVLVSINDISKVENLLLGKGFIKDDYIQTVLNDWEWRHHHITFFHPEKKVKLEVHWRLNPGPGKEPEFKDLWSRKRESMYSNLPVYYLGREDLLLFLVSHGARHGWSRLRWLLDIHHIFLKEINTDKLNKLSREHDNAHLVSQAIVLSSELFGTNIKKEYFEKNITGKTIRLAQQAIFYLERMVNLHCDPVPKDISRYHSRHLFLLMSAKQKLLYLLSLLHPFPEDAQTFPLPKAIHFLYFPLRPFIWVWRKTRKSALS